MKRLTWKTGLVLSVVALIIFLVAQLMLKQDQKVLIANNLKTVPDCQVYDMEGTIISLRQVVDKPTLLMAFDPECEHCEYQIRALVQQLSLLAETQILLITSADSGTIRQFITDKKLERHPQIHVLRSEAEVFFETFGNSGIPACFIYNASGMLQKTFRGEWRIDVIANQLKKEQ